MTIVLKHEKATRQYEKYISDDHGCIASIYIPKEEFNGIKVPRTISIEVPLVEVSAQGADAK